MQILTFHPIALKSGDYKDPSGTKNNTNNKAFNKKLYELFPKKKIKILDIGCAGGAFIKDCIKDGHCAIGIDGSDFNKNGLWKEYPNNFFTVDVGQPFEIVNDDLKTSYFDVITAWELLEHLPEEDVNIFLRNIVRHLYIDGYFIVSINVATKAHANSIYKKGWGPGLHHQNVQTPEWWDNKFLKFGLIDNYELRTQHFAGEFIRGPGRGCSGDFTEERMRVEQQLRYQWATINRVMEFCI